MIIINRFGAPNAVAKGDSPGHAFRGNQYGAGTGGGADNGGPPVQRYDMSSTEGTFMATSLAEKHAAHTAKLVNEESAGVSNSAYLKVSMGKLEGQIAQIKETGSRSQRNALIESATKTANYAASQTKKLGLPKSQVAAANLKEMVGRLDSGNFGD